MKTLRKILCSILALVITFSTVLEVSADPFEIASPTLIRTGKGEVIYETSNTYTPIRLEPSNDGHIVSHCHEGVYITGEPFINEKGNTWVRFYGTNNETYYVFSGNLTEHTAHCWNRTIQSDTGVIHVCDCGYVSAKFDKIDRSIEFDGLALIEEVIKGNYSDTRSEMGILISILASFTPLDSLMDLRDFTADISACVKGQESCSPTGLVFDLISLLPLIDAFGEVSSLRYVDDFDPHSGIIKYIDNDFFDTCDLDCFQLLVKDEDVILIGTYGSIVKMYKTSDVQVHHLVEKRMSELFDLNERDFLSTPLVKAEHQIYTNRWREVIPYGTDYSSLTKEMIDEALCEVYGDNPELLKQVLEWTATHYKAT